MKILALIPARMGSRRFPGKPMAPILGKPMIGHVFERVRGNALLTLAAVATCDRTIAEYMESIGGRVVMTDATHERASDRCAQALKILEKEDSTRFDVIVMIQGDEPMIHPDMITEAVRPVLEDASVHVTNLAGAVDGTGEFEDRNCIKVVRDLAGNALYFSREPVPTRAQTRNPPMWKQVCVIAFRRKMLLRYIRMSPTPLEVAESIDMMRFLEHGLKVRMVPTRYRTHAVDTPADLAAVERRMRLAATA